MSREQLKPAAQSELLWHESEMHIPAGPPSAATPSGSQSNPSGSRKPPSMPVPAPAEATR
jgi:hypothetical protein